MLKKAFIFIIVAAVVVAGILVFRAGNLETTRNHPASAIPSNASVVFRSKDFQKLWNQLAQTNLMWQEVTQMPYFQQLDENGALLDSLIRKNGFLSNALTESPIYASMHKMGENRFEMLYNMQLAASREELLQALSTLGFVQPNSRLVETSEIFTLTLNDYHKKQLYLTLNQEVLSLGFSVVLIEDAINHLNKKSGVIEDKQFRKVLSTSGEYVDANVFIQYKRFNELIASSLNVEMREDFGALLNFADWAALDLTLKPNALMFNGFTAITDSSSSFLKCFQGQSPQDMDLLTMVPDGTSNLLCFGLSNFERFREHYMNYLSARGEFEQFKQWRDSINELMSVDIEEEMQSIVGSEFGTFYFGEYNRSFEQQKFAIIKTLNFNKARGFLAALSNPVEGDLGEQGVQRMNMLGLVSNYFGENFSGLEQPLWIAKDPYIIFGNNASSMQLYLNDLSKKKTLRKNENFRHFSENLSGQTSVFLYTSFSRSKNFYQSCLSDDWIQSLEVNRDLLNKFEALAIQFSAEKRNLFYQNVYMNYNPVLKKASTSLWETTLDTLIASVPYTVINHYTNAKEIFVQDLANKVYLLDNKGNILWKKQLKERIMSDVKQIDVYKNNKLQLLFNTASELHLIDRKGRYVTDYPAKIKGGSSAGLTLIDYDKNRNYRILIPTKTKKIVNFSSSGKLVKGWKTPKTAEVITQPLEYFALNKRDYIVAVDQTGKVYVMNRKGEERLKVDGSLPMTVNNTFFLEIQKDINLCKLVSADSNGTIVKLRFDGNVEKIEIDTFSVNHTFQYQDINNDKNYEYIFLDNQELRVYGPQKEKVFEVNLEDVATPSMTYFSTIGKYGKFGIVDAENGQVYLYLDAGGLDNNFPLKGTTDFCIDDVNSDGLNDVIIGLDSAIVTYILRR